MSVRGPIARTDSEATADCPRSAIRWGGRWSATSCHTRRGIETMSTFPGGLGRRGGDPAGRDRPRRRRGEHRDGGGQQAADGQRRHRVMTDRAGPGTAPRSPRPARPPPTTSSTAARPASAMRSAAAGSARSAATAAASARASPMGTIRPLTPSRITSGHQAHRRRDHGPAERQRLGRARAVPTPRRRGSPRRRPQRSSSGALSLGPASRTVPSRPRAWIWSGQLAGQRALADDRDAHVDPAGPQERGRLDQGREPLLRVQAGDADDERLAVDDAEAVPDLLAGAQGLGRRPEGRMTRTGREVCSCT